MFLESHDTEYEHLKSLVYVSKEMYLGPRDFEVEIISWWTIQGMKLSLKHGITSGILQS